MQTIRNSTQSFGTRRNTAADYSFKTRCRINKRQRTIPWHCMERHSCQILINNVEIQPTFIKS